MTYESWRISYQSSEQAARAAYAKVEELAARLAELEGQEPVGEVIHSDVLAGKDGAYRHELLCDFRLGVQTELYARPAPAEPVNARLLAIATGQLQHIYSENCPDPVSWPNSRDPECPACRAIIAAESEASPAYGPDNPPRLRRPDESVEAYREAMGWPTIHLQAKGD